MASPLLLQAAPVAVERLGLSRGLSQSTVYDIAQDREGYIWFATGDGLNRFDGETIRHIRYQRDNTNSLSDNYARSLLVDRQGDIWVGTLGGGLNRYNPATATWHHYRAGAELPGDDIHSLFLADDGALWVGGEGWLARYSGADERFQLYTGASWPALFAESAITTITMTATGELWFGFRRGGFSRLNPDTGEGQRYSHFLNGQAIPMAVNTLYEDSQHRLWLGLESGGLVQFDIQRNGIMQGSVLPLPTPHEVTSLLEDSQGGFWAGTWSRGLVRFQPGRDQVQVLKHSAADPASLTSNTVISLFEDRSGVLWAGSWDSGANRLAYQHLNFPHYRYDPLDYQGLYSRMVWAFAETDTRELWVATRKGLNVLSLAPDGHAGELRRPVCAPVVEGLDIRALLAEGPELWLGTAGNGLQRLNTESCVLERPPGLASLASSSVRLLLKAPDGALWIGTSNGLYVWQASTRQLRHYRADSSNPDALPHNRIRALYLAPSGQVWIGTSGGLSRYDAAGDRFSTLTEAQGQLSGNDVRSIYQDAQGYLWIATGTGLTRYQLDTGESRFYTEADGLSNNTLYGLMPQGGRLWITTNRGLSRFDPATEQFTNYFSQHGLQSNEFNFNAYRLVDERFIAAGGVNGFNYFDSQAINRAPSQPQLSLAATVTQDGVPSTVTFSGAPQPLSLSEHDELEFNLSALHYQNPQQNRLEYRLVGLESEWQRQTGVAVRQHYGGLPPGEYRFEVRAISSHHQPSSLAEWSITVEPGLLNSWWARGVYLSAILLLGYLLYRYRNLYRKSRALYLDKLIAERTNHLYRQKRQFEQQLEMSRKACDQGRTQMADILAGADDALVRLVERTNALVAGDPEAVRALCDSLREEHARLVSQAEQHLPEHKVSALVLAEPSVPEVPSAMAGEEGQIVSEREPQPDKDSQFISTIECEAIALLRARNCSLEQLASQIHQSPRTLQRKLKRILDCSYTEFIQSIQLRLAREALEQGETVKAAAYQAGFQDPATLSRLFKRSYGVPPSQYQRSLSSVE